MCETNLLQQILISFCLACDKMVGE